MKFFRSIFLCFTIWVLSALLNAVLGGIWLYFFSGEFTSWPEPIFITFIFTLIFSVPGIFIFWIVLLINWDEELLFRSLLKAGFIVSALSSLLLFILPFYDFKHQQFFLSLCIVIAAITSVMIHHSRIKSISLIK